jgi:hypothetical protein
VTGSCLSVSQSLCGAIKSNLAPRLGTSISVGVPGILPGSGRSPWLGHIVVVETERFTHGPITLVFGVILESQQTPSWEGLEPFLEGISAATFGASFQPSGSSGRRSLSSLCGVMCPPVGPGCDCWGQGTACVLYGVPCPVGESSDHSLLRWLVSVHMLSTQPLSMGSVHDHLERELGRDPSAPPPRAW